MQDDQRYSQLLALRARTTQAQNNSVLNNIQMGQLRNQIIAYRCLARNQPIPHPVMMALQGKRPDGSPQFPTPPTSPFQQGQPGEQAAPAPEGPGKPVRSAFLSFLVRIFAVAETKPGPSQQRTPGGQLVPAKQSRITTMPKPCGIDPIVLLQERENRVAARIAARIEQVSLKRGFLVEKEHLCS